MSEKIMKKSRVLIAALLGTVMIAALTLWGCSGSGYDDVNAALDATITTPKTPAIIDAATLRGWIDEGKLNAPAGSLDRVALVTVSSMKNYTTAGKKKLHIPGASLFSADTELYATREEGFGPVSSMVPSGAQMDTVIKKLGIDANTTIVLTIPKASGDSDHYPQSRAYFTFRYWGFDRNRIKILNGGDDAWEVDVVNANPTKPVYALTKTDTIINPSTYSVANNKAGLKDILRYSLSEMIERVDALMLDPAQLISSWQMVEARGIGTSPYFTNALRTQDLNPKGWAVVPPATTAITHALMFLEDRVDNVATRNRLYPVKAKLEERMTSYNLKAGIADALLSPTKKTVVMCGSAISASPSFVLFDAVLGVPEGQIMMYDGSSSQWNGYSNARITAANPAATGGQIAAWAFDTRVTFDGTGTAAANWPASTLFLTPGFAAYAPSNPLMNQIETADKAYMTPAAASTSSSVSGSAGGGC